MNYARNSFHKAAEAMLLLSGRSRIAAGLAVTIINAQKFILPDAGKLTDGKPFAEISDAMRLPFDRIALLREIEVDGQVLQQICVAAEPAYVNMESTADFFVADLICASASHNLWLPSRFVGVQFGLPGGGVQTFEIEGAIEEERAIFRGADDHANGWGALNGLCELMLMLSLSNVGTARVAGPAFLNNKRKKSGKLPIYDYHVLTIDGQRVCGRDASDPTDRHLRSHFRRGHIRRLDESRRVWVRAAYVHGRAAGFVDKDYVVVDSKANAQAQAQDACGRSPKANG